MLNYPKLDVVKIDAYAKSGQNSSKFSQDIEQKRTLWKDRHNLHTS